MFSNALANGFERSAGSGKEGIESEVSEDRCGSAGVPGGPVCLASVGLYLLLTRLMMLIWGRLRPRCWGL